MDDQESAGSCPNKKVRIACQVSGCEPVLVSRTTEGELRSPHKKQHWDSTASIFNNNSPSVSPKWPTAIYLDIFTIENGEYIISRCVKHEVRVDIDDLEFKRHHNLQVINTVLVQLQLTVCLLDSWVYPMVISLAQREIVATPRILQLILWGRVGSRMFFLRNVRLSLT